MGRLVYSVICSLDGYVADADGRFDWAAPGEEVHAFVNDLERGVGTYLYGRRMYETMVAWEDMSLGGQPPAVRDFASLWRAADKVVYSTQLASASSARTRIEHVFDPGGVRRMKERASRDLSIGGPTLAAQAIHAGLVDDYQMIVVPVLVGAGTAALPDDVRVALELADVRRFDNGMVFMHYVVR